MLLCGWQTHLVRAQLGPEGAPITTSDYAVDLFRGPVLSTSRITGLGGAAVAIAEGVEGGLQNPAAVAARYIGSVEWWDYYLAFGLTYPLSTEDFYNSGKLFEQTGDLNAQSDFLFLTPGAYLQLGNFGMGLSLDYQQGAIRRQAGSTGGIDSGLELSFTTARLQLGYSMLDGQMQVGAGLRLVGQKAVARGPALSTTGEVYAESASGLEGGIIIRPNGRQWRLGASLYGPVRKSLGTADRVTQIEQPGGGIDDFYLPQRIEQPWQGSIGAAWQIGPRPLNPRFTYVERFAAKEFAAIDAHESEIEWQYGRVIAALPPTGGLEVEGRRQALTQDRARWRKYFAWLRAQTYRRVWRTLRRRVRRGWSRKYLLISTELMITGRVANAVGVESLLAGRVQRSGENISLSPRLGLESEVVPHWLKLRAGTYLEPSRFRNAGARLHGTFGVDLKIIQWDVFDLWPEDYLWQVSGALDFTPGYFALSVGIGGWY